MTPEWAGASIAGRPFLHLEPEARPSCGGRYPPNMDNKYDLGTKILIYI
jgi:hypothetical protein